MKYREIKVSNQKELDDCPLPLSVIPNYMGINLCSVEGVSWVEQDDNQIVSLTINFIPEPKQNDKYKIVRFAIIYNNDAKNPLVIAAAQLTKDFIEKHKRFFSDKHNYKCLLVDEKVKILDFALPT